MTVQYITNDLDTANTLLEKGWLVKDNKLEVKSFPVDIKGLSEYGIEVAMGANRTVARTIVLELTDAVKCPGIHGDSTHHNYSCCSERGYIKNKELLKG